MTMAGEIYLMNALPLLNTLFGWPCQLKTFSPVFQGTGCAACKCGRMFRGEWGGLCEASVECNTESLYQLKLMGFPFYRRRGAAQHRTRLCGD